MKYPVTSFHIILLLFFLPVTMSSAGTEPSAQANTPITAFLLLDDSGARFPFPHHVQYASGTILPSHRTRTQMDNDVRVAYTRWKTRYLVTVPGSAPGGGPLYRISYGLTNPGRTVSEGQGYGMVIVALMAGYDSEAKSIVEGLWCYARQHPSSVDSRLMTWQIPEDPATGADSAFDGDADIAYGLLLAHAQWGSQGRVNFRAEATERIRAIRESTIGADSRLPMLGDWVKEESAGSQYNQYSPRSSDFMPAHFRAFADFSENETWNQVVTSTGNAITHMQNTYSPATGLLPDFMVPVSAADHTLKPAPANFLEGPHDGHYDYNAGRVPWRIGTDALINSDAASLTQTRKIANWIAGASGGNAAGIKSGYKLDGTPTAPDADFTTFFAAPFGVAVMTTPAHQQFLNDIYDAVVTVQEDYYEDTVTLLCLLVMSGNYWTPVP